MDGVADQFPTEALVYLRALRSSVLIATVRTGPQLLLVGEEVGREDGLTLDTIHCPTLYALEMKEPVALSTAPYLGGGGRGSREGVRERGDSLRHQFV